MCDMKKKKEFLFDKSNYKFVIIDEDSSGLDHERIMETIKMSNADTKVIEINEDQEAQSIMDRITASKK